MPSMRRSPIWSDPRVKPPYGSVLVNGAHPLSADLAFLFLLNERAGNIYSLGPRPNGGKFTDTTHIVWTPNGVNFDGTAGTSIDLTASQALWNIPAPFSIAFWWDWQSGTKQAYGGPVNNRVASQNGFQIVDVGASTASYRTELLVWNGSAETTTLAQANSDLDSGAGYNRPFNKRFLWTWDGSVAGMYTEGISRGTSATSGGFPTSEKAVNIGGGYSTMAGTLNHVIVWTRALTANEALWLASEPYVFLSPIIRRRHFIPPAATGGKGSFFPFFVPGLLSTPS